MNSPRAPRCTRARQTCGLPRKLQTQNITRQPEILVVEDGSGLFPKIGAMLQDRGFQVFLAPDADTALQEIGNYDFAAVIVGASREKAAGLRVLAAIKERRADIKTMVVTRLLNPQLPVAAYEMEIDDYIHWPLSSAELSGRVRGLLEFGLGEDAGDWSQAEQEAQHDYALRAMGTLVDGFTDSLAMISQSLDDLRQEHSEEMAERLAAELLGIAAQVSKLGESMRQCWHLGAVEPVSRSKPPRFH